MSSNSLSPVFGGFDDIFRSPWMNDDLASTWPKEPTEEVAVWGELNDPTASWDHDNSTILAAKLQMLGLDNQPLLNDNFVLSPLAVDAPRTPSSSARVSGNFSPSLDVEGLLQGVCRGPLANPRFKTEMCRNYKDKGNCLYGDQCQFAHGNHELRQDVMRHNKYKTKLCQKYWIAGHCAYGPRCNFIHREAEAVTSPSMIPTSAVQRPRDSTAPGPGYLGDPKPQIFYSRTMNHMNGPIGGMMRGSLGDSGDSSSDDKGPSIWREPLSINRSPWELANTTTTTPSFSPKFSQFFPENDILGTGTMGVGPIGSGRPNQRIARTGN